MNARRLMEEVSLPLNPRLCKNCRWVRVPWTEKILFLGDRYKFARCVRPGLQDTSGEAQELVDGKKQERYIYAEIERGHFPMSCGPQGRYWEKKGP